MNISIFHYHLNTGGVTRIIESQVAGFKKKFPEARVQVIVGHCHNTEIFDAFGVKIFVNEKLNYLADKNYYFGELQNILDDIFYWIDSKIENDEILHIHNLNLGKNPLLPLVFELFLKKGLNIINHAHDFAEDRPANLTFLQTIIGGFFRFELKSIMYPDSARYLVGVLNQFDYERIIKYGMPADRVFLWPNPVLVPKKGSKAKKQNREKLLNIFKIPANHNIITYPVRVIQRKNIGELILLSQIFANTCTFMVTLAPQNPIEIQFYKDWKNFCQENSIPLIFEAGQKAAFGTIISGSDYCITTSIREGFGMAFLEPWLFGTPVVGRNIEYVTTDIKKSGFIFPLLYNRLTVPFYNQQVDFKDLSFDRQQAIILNIIQGVLNIEHIFALNSFLLSFPPKISNDVILENQKTIKLEYSIEKYAERIFKAYKTLPR